MRKTIETLIQLQEIDGHLRALEESKGDLPQRISALTGEIEQLQDSLNDKLARIEKTQSDHREASAEVAMLKERQKKYQTQLYQVKTNKEYDAITLELENTAQSIEKYEYKMLELEEIEERLKAEAEQLKPQLQQLQATLADLQQQLQITMEQNAEKEAELIQSRASLTSQLTPQVLNLYERIRRGRGGTAVAFLRDGACSECSSRVPSQRSLEIRMMNNMFVCEICGRILVWDEKGEHSTVEEKISVDK